MRIKESVTPRLARERRKFGDFEATEVGKALDVGRKYFEGFQLLVIIKKETDPEEYFTARSIEMGVVSTGESEREAMENLIALMAFHVQDYIEQGIEEKIFIATPSEVMFSFANMEKVKKKSQPKFPRRWIKVGAAFATA